MNRFRLPLASAALAGMAVLAADAGAQSDGGTYRLDVVAIGGSGISRAHSACFVVSATLGQAAGVASGGAFDLASGPWAALPAPGDDLFEDSFEDCSP